MNPSIRNRLLLTLLPATLIVWALVSVVTLTAARHEVEELIDAQLAQSTHVLMNLLGHEAQDGKPLLGDYIEDEIRLQHYPGFAHRYQQQVAFQILTLDDHRLRLRSHGAPAFRMSEQDSGFSDRMIENLPWRVYVLTDSDRGFQVQLGGTLGPRKDVVGEIAMRVMVPLMVAIPLLGLLIWYGVGRSMQPLRKIAHDVKRRRPDNLHPISDPAVPAEAVPLVNALNTLFLRLQHAFETERRFTADAAHELRTPLAALKAQAQVALRASEDAVRRDALLKVITGVDRATRLSEQLLTLARIDPEVWAGREVVKIQEIASGVLADIAPLALARDIDLSLAGIDAPAGPIRGDRSMLGILLRNLVDNALKYSPEHGAVEVRIGQSGPRVFMTVTDSGPGIPPEERARVFERFYRQIGTQSPGSGLGLSIVKRIADLHRAEIRLDSSPRGGLLVEVSFTSS